MTISSIASQTQAGIRVHGQIDTFFNRFRIGTLLHQCGIRKRHGHSVRSLTQTIQCRDYDALVGHTSIVFMRYMFLSYHCRLSTDQRSFGKLFHACCEEIQDISFLESLLRILTLAADRMKSIGSSPFKVVLSKTCENDRNALI
jgi:hypothetical protein